MKRRKNISKTGDVHDDTVRTSLPNKSPKVIAAIPCFRTKDYIGDVVSKAKKHVDQVVVIDDGSQDSTAEVAIAAGALVRSHDTNKGYGVAIRSCFEVASMLDTTVLVILDGDGQHDPDDIPKLLAPITQGKADLVIGSRFLRRKVSMPRYRKFGIKIITCLFNLWSTVRVSDAQSGFRVYSRKIFGGLSLSEKGMSVSIEILEKIRRRRMTIVELPISCRYANSTICIGAIWHGFCVALAVLKIRLVGR